MRAAMWIAVLAGAALGQSVDTSPAFEFVDVHVSAPATNPTMRGGSLRGGRYEVRTATLVDLISMAYGMEGDKILGGPKWLDWDRFDVAAKAPEGKQKDLGMMLQKLLADRFKLAVHKDIKPMPAYVLTAAKGKPKMKAAAGSGEPKCRPAPQNPAAGAVPYVALSCINVTMAVFADVLHDWAGGTYLADPVVDGTGIAGEWDFELKWTQRNRLAQAGSDGISLFDALEKQLGLKLEAKKAPLPVLIVDSVNQQPTPNDPAVTAKIPPAPPTEFDVATVKLSAPANGPPNGNFQNGRIDLHNFTLKRLIQLAWDLGNNDELVVGIPRAAEGAHYDVVAKVATSGQMNSQDVDFDTLRLMLRNLLVERFAMRAHMEDRPVNAYTMTATKQLKLQRADPQNRTNCKSGGGASPMLNRLVTCQNMTTTQFAAELQNRVSGYVKTPVKDATGIEGSWDFSVNFSGVGLLPGGQFDPNSTSETSDPNGSLSFPEAMQKQLGLRLQMEKRPIPVLVVEHVDEKPTEN